MNRSNAARLGPVAGIVVLAVALFTIALQAPAGAVVADDPVTGFVRVGHFAPSQQPVDVVVDGKVVVRDLAYRSITAYIRVLAGNHEFALRDTGTAENPILSIDAGVPASGAVTIGAVTTRTGLAAQVYDDKLQTPGAGDALVRFIHTAPAASAVNISVIGGRTLASGLGYPEATGYQTVKAGTYDLQVTSAKTRKVVLRIPRWNAAPGSQSSVVIIQSSDGQLDVVPVSDAVGATTAPNGGVATGLGGLALGPRPSPSSSPTAPAVALLLAGVAALILGLVLSSAAAGRRRS